MDCYLSFTGNIFSSPSIQLLETSGTVQVAVKELMLAGYLLKTFTGIGAQNVFQEDKRWSFPESKCVNMYFSSVLLSNKSQVSPSK